jgi:hypothetical protein
MPVRTIALLGLALATVPPTIIRRGDRDDAKYLAAGARYSAVITLGRAGDATLIAPHWLLTAGHVAAAVRNRASVTIGGRDYAIARVVVHPEWRELGPHDVGLVQLARAVDGITPIALNRSATERGAVATLVGHGGTGAGNSRTRTEDGRARAATSRVDSVSAAWLYFSFDAPPGGTELEGAPGPGDSGGPAIVTVNGSNFVAGVSSAGFDGRDGPGSYGAVDVFTRVSTHAAWIDSVMASPAPPGGTSAIPSRATTPGTQEPRLPDTPVGRRYTAFLQAMRAGSDSAILAFLRTNFDDAELAARPAEARLANFRRLSERLRDAKIEAITKAEPLVLTARLAGAMGATTIELICSREAPNKIVDWRRYD